jgi:hypothetical protein
MLQIEVDVFSGRPNPVWFITDEDEVRRFLGSVAEARVAHTKVGQGPGGLGFREVRVASVSDDEPPIKRLPREFALGSITAEDSKASAELALKVVEGMTEHAGLRLVQHTLTPLTAEIRDRILEEMRRAFANPPVGPKPGPPQRNPLRKTVPDKSCKKCEYEISKFNPGFWNAPGVQPHNNCYNYARNWRTNTFAQPGRAHGADTDIMSCPTVTDAAMADGLHKRCDCLPDREYPRRLMALVVAPDYDYHWYREQMEGFWGHKPGGTAARNHDNNGVVIVNPETCARAPYTDFCGYFYAGKSVVIN